MMPKRLRRRNYVTPNCCPEAANGPIVLKYDINDYERNENDPLPKPTWELRGLLCGDLKYAGPAEYDLPRTAPKFCPYCAEPLPEIVRANTGRRKIQNITDGGYYCDTCLKSNACECAPMVFHWKPKPRKRKTKKNKCQPNQLKKQ